MDGRRIHVHDGDHPVHLNESDRRGYGNEGGLHAHAHEDHRAHANESDHRAHENASDYYGHVSESALLHGVYACSNASNQVLEQKVAVNVQKLTCSVCSLSWLCST